VRGDGETDDDGNDDDDDGDDDLWTCLGIGSGYLVHLNPYPANVENMASS